MTLRVILGDSPETSTRLLMYIWSVMNDNRQQDNGDTAVLSLLLCRPSTGSHAATSSISVESLLIYCKKNSQQCPNKGEIIQLMD